jgi:hypothetical protein
MNSEKFIAFSKYCSSKNRRFSLKTQKKEEKVHFFAKIFA